MIINDHKLIKNFKKNLKFRANRFREIDLWFLQNIPQLLNNHLNQNYKMDICILKLFHLVWFNQLKSRANINLIILYYCLYINCLYKNSQNIYK
jgi:hypothetical protein